MKRKPRHRPPSSFMPAITDNDRSRFHKKYVAIECGCWIWKAYVDHKGYGQFWLAQRAYWAHRAAWMIFRGMIPDGCEIDHKCLTESCVNPDHLEPVSGTTNRQRQNGV